MSVWKDIRQKSIKKEERIENTTIRKPYDMMLGIKKLHPARFKVIINGEEVNVKLVSFKK